MNRTVLAATLLATTSVANASILLFVIDGLGNFDPIPQDYGDRVTATTIGIYHYGIGTEGPTPNIIATYPTAGGVDPSHWGTGYGDLRDVYFDDADGVGHGEVILSADYGYEVVLYSFEMAAYSSVFSSDPTIDAVRVMGCSPGALFEQTNAVISETTHTTFDFTSSPLQDREIRIQFESGNLAGLSDDIALDTIRFGQVEVAADEMTCPSDIAVRLCVLDVFDVFGYLDLFAAGDELADFTFDGTLDIFDVFAFLDEFNAGCGE
ncbi:MAG: hypothetical protein KC996_02845 [Phycisphaerales bacterium]|nr:hypothetical protein [Phycisphaerales bacterium]